MVNFLKCMINFKRLKYKKLFLAEKKIFKKIMFHWAGTFWSIFRMALDRERKKIPGFFFM